MAISGVGVALATAGGVLVYAGLRGESPLVALRDIASGKPPALSAVSGAPGQVGAAAGSAAAAGLAAASAARGVGAGSLSGLPNVLASQFGGDRYSQARRWDPGFSDCSSFVGKGLKAMGITPPGASVTTDYLAWTALGKIDRSQVGPGDLLVSTSHMACAIDVNTAIGQQNPRRNVRVGPIESDIMFGTGSFLCLRYLGTVTHTTTGSTGFTY